MPGARLVGDSAIALVRVHSDTRTLAAGDLFVALKGERFDANDFLPEARARGAAAAIAHPGRLEPAGLAGLEVADTLAALGQLAAGWRAQFRLPLIAVTGSNGKTTVTQMIASILIAACADRALATAGNFNNDIGVPLTLLRLRERHQRAVVELGMNHPGEIARLAAMAQPTIALVNNAQREHQEFMDGVEAVARENGAVFAALPDSGTAVFPHGDAFTGLWSTLARKGAARRCLTFGEAPDADISLAQAQWGQGALGRRRTHAARRWRRPDCVSRASTTCVTHWLLQRARWRPAFRWSTIAAGLSAFEPVKGRSRASELRRPDGRSLTLVDDSYNANPDSVLAAIDVLAALPGPRLLALGDMGEVGNRGPQFHAEVGAYARECGIDALFGLGTLAAYSVEAFGSNTGARHFESLESLNEALVACLGELRSVLVKGSRFMQMERVVSSIAAAAASAPPQGEPGHVA